MEIIICNTTPQMVPVVFGNGDEYELQSETVLTLTCEPGAEIEVQEDRIEVEGVASPLGGDESIDDTDNAKLPELS
jgi:hypothetical protein